ncbi:MAG: amino acid decarboxylase [Clostridia bacterium]|nr:amino acid decarboxylase [Clostridia bacterium]
MNTPICEFLENYVQKGATRLHMPGHKGIGETEKYDLTEIDGADSLYEASGIIAQSEKNAGGLFGAHTFYSAEGSSLAIRAMLYLATLHAASRGEKARVLAGRNAHKTFVSAVALLGTEVEWLTGGGSYLSCRVTAETVREYFENAQSLPTAVYLTSPDYLGNMADIAGVARVCRENGVLLLVDNAHGAYLKFLPESMHPIDLGAHMCCDSAHKTLPALTGCAYLHVAKDAPQMLSENAKNALALFGSTSPSYLLLASLDAANKYLAENYREKLAAFVGRLELLKKELRAHGYAFSGNEPLKLTFNTKAYGYLGAEMAEYLTGQNFVPEFYDPDFLVLMFTPEISEGEMARLRKVLLALPKRTEIFVFPPRLSLPERAMHPREAVLSACEKLPVEKCVGKTLAAVTVGCPPAVPIAVSGEVIDESTVKCFKYYGISHCNVVKE